MKLYFGIGVALLMIFKEAGGQEIIFEPVSYITHCTDGLLNKIDKFVVTGTVGKNYSEYAALGWESLIYVDILKPGSSKFETVCSVIIGDPATFCGSSVFNCSCDSVNTTTGTVHFTVNYEAQAYYSQGIIQGRWSNRTQTNYSKNNVTLRAMYDVNQTSLELKINGRPATGRTGSCGVNFVSQEDNTISLCCLNTTSPCYPKLSFDGQVVASGKEKCVDYTYKPHNTSYTVNVTMSYSVCTQPESTPAYSCVITTELPPTHEPSTSESTTPSESKPGEQTCDITCIILLAVLIPVIVIAAIVVALIYCYCKKICCCKKRKGSKSFNPSHEMNAQNGETNTESPAPISHRDSRDSTPRKDRHEKGIKEDSGKNLETVDGDISNNKTDLEHASHLDKINRNQHDNKSSTKNQSGSSDIGLPNKNQHEYVNASYHPDESDNTTQLKKTNTDQIDRKKSHDKTTESKRLNSNEPRPLPRLSNKM